MSDEHNEMVMRFRGERGEKGDPGATGPGLGARTARSVVFLFVLAFLIAGASLLLTSREIAANNAAQQRLQQAQQAVQRRAGQLVEHAICTDLGTMARILPPAGSPAVNPARAYEQAEHRAWQGLFTSLDCR